MKLYAKASKTLIRHGLEKFQKKVRFCINSRFGAPALNGVSIFLAVFIFFPEKQTVWTVIF
jgi:hypothetical protein